MVGFGVIFGHLCEGDLVGIDLRDPGGGGWWRAHGSCHHRSVRHHLLLAISVLAVLVAPLRFGGVAAAQPSDPSPQQLAEARELFDRGIRLTRQERWAEALELFRRSRAVAERPSTVFNMATVLARLGRAREALQAVRDFQRIADPERDAEMREQAREMERTLRESFAQLELTVTPGDAEVRVDGEWVSGNGSRRQLLLDPGDHVVRVSATGHTPVEFRLSVLAGSRGERTVDLTAERARLVVRSSVDDARIAVDGTDAGIGEVTLELEPGDHRVAVIADDHAPFERTVDLEPGQRFTLDAALESEGGGGGVLTSPIFWTIVGVVVVGGAAATIVAVATSGGNDIYTGTAGFVLYALR
jgi:hypothetical protein